MTEVDDIVYYHGIEEYRAIACVTSQPDIHGRIFALGMVLHRRSESVEEMILAESRCIIIGSLNDFKDVT